MQASDDWTARMLGLQLQAASASGHHQATLYFGFKRLESLAAQAVRIARDASAPLLQASNGAAPVRDAVLKQVFTILHVVVMSNVLHPDRDSCATCSFSWAKQLS